MSTDTVSPLRQRMIEDMTSRQLGAHTQRGHIYSCRRFAAFLKRSPDTATAEDIRLFQLHLAETGMSICNRNRIMTGVRFLFRVTLRRLDLATEIYHMREPEKLPLVMSKDEMKRLLAVATSLKARVMLSLSYGCGLRAGEVVRLKVKHIDTAQKVIRVEQGKGPAPAKAGGARIGMSCCRATRSLSCANGGRCAARHTMPERRRRNGFCFQAARAASRRARAS